MYDLLPLLHRVSLPVIRMLRNSSALPNRHVRLLEQEKED